MSEENKQSVYTNNCPDKCGCGPGQQEKCCKEYKKLPDIIDESNDKNVELSEDMKEDCFDINENIDNIFLNMLRCEEEDDSETQLQRVNELFNERYKVKKILIDDKTPSYCYEDEEGQEHFFTEEFIADVVVSYFQDQEILIRDFALRSIAKTLCLKYVNGYNIRMVNELVDYLTI